MSTGLFVFIELAISVYGLVAIIKKRL